MVSRFAPRLMALQLDETGGALTFVARAPTADEERHDVLVTKIGDLETSLASISQQLASLAGQLPPR